MSKLSTILTAAVAVAVLSSASFAAPILTLTAKIVQSNNTGTTTKNATPGTINSSSFQATASTPVQDYLIEVDASITGFDPNHAFGGLAFDVTISGATRGSGSTYNWKANNPIWTNDASDPEFTYGTAKDAGPSSSDLAGITAVVDNSTAADEGSGVYGGDSADPRLGLMKTTTKVGTYQISWDPAQGPATLNFANVQFNQIDLSNLTLGTPAYDQIVNPSQFNVSGVTFAAPATTPEPASLGVLALGGAALLARRKKA